MAPYRKHVLTPVVIRNLKPGRHADGDGLYLFVEPTGAKRWVLRIVVDGRRRDIGLGGYSPGFEPKAGADVLAMQLHPGSIAAARREAARMRAMARSGSDPLAARNTLRAEERAKRKTFREYAADYIAAHKPSWSNPKHAAQWTSTLTTYVYDHFGDITIGHVTRAMVLDALRPIWTEKRETASRVRQRIESILDAAKADGYRTGDNPAAWAGSLETSLPRRSKVATVEHHAALPYASIYDFREALAKQAGVAARALEFAILTVARTGEIIGATADEVDLLERTWTVPASRMKAGKPHRVPLSDAAIALIKDRVEAGGLLFPGPKDDTPMSNMAMLAVLKRMKRQDITVHGFRSTFRDWAGEQTAYPREVIEHALAHQLADAAEAAYQRGDLLRKRRALMDDWARYCATRAPKSADVTPIRKKTAA